MRLRNLHLFCLPPFRRQSPSLTCCIRFVKASLEVCVATSVAHNTHSRPPGPLRNSHRALHRPTKGCRSYVFDDRNASPVATLPASRQSTSRRTHLHHHTTRDSNGGQVALPPRSSGLSHREASPGIEPDQHREKTVKASKLRSVPSSTVSGPQNHDQQRHTASPTSPASAARSVNPLPCHRSRTQSTRDCDRICFESRYLI